MSSKIKEDLLVKQIKHNSLFLSLVKKRNRLSLILTTIMLITYFGFIGLIAFNKAFLAKQIGDSVVTIGLPVGFAMILISILLTWIFVRKANGEFDAMRDELLTSLDVKKDV
ncbi:DUF485 domain-containing protein [Thorsellia anophelis]|uniref:Uncharacterized membrane protein, DUF485 family n=1 Tax=Thorsellia anophelis DSM 18579 TaxID=1123402 RepID=A0A1I0EFN5_9GAMM|nr:DUF485 domain-containing protein [Thorsellia anophelis]SET44100.1 Uncharacterized membrane protein, DUF485 family [Thorsellia anophelis DSM 18579]